MECQTKFVDYSEDFYRLENVRVVDFVGDAAVVPYDMWTRLCGRSVEPLIQLDGNRYWLTPQDNTPADTIGIPNLTVGESNAEVMLAKNSKLRELVRADKIG